MSGETYIEYDFTTDPPQPANDILIAQLGELAFESFAEHDAGIFAYIRKDDWHEDILCDVGILRHPGFKISFVFRQIEPENWNESWEKSFSPIRVGKACVVRAPFHSDPGVPYDIVIAPKMSFGTGHHETTRLMLRLLLKYEMEGKLVLDMGCGTGVLAILAAKKNARLVDAIDNDPWCFLNAMENVERNGVGNVHVHEGDATLLKDRTYGCILANINRNILITDIPIYAKHLSRGGLLMVSGFYREDEPGISALCNDLGLRLTERMESNNWMAAVYVSG